MTDRLDEIRKRNVAALDMVTALCKPRDTEGARDWRMSIPARPDYDPDLVISASLCDVAYLLAEVERWKAIANGQSEDFADFQRQQNDRGYP